MASIPDFEPHAPDSLNRDHLQSLTIAELMHEAHALADRLPNKFATPDRAWQWLRLAIEPMSFDIRREESLSGPRYVGYWAGGPICSVPCDGGNAYDAIHTMMVEFFAATYPRHLSASRWCVQHIALPMEAN